MKKILIALLLFPAILSAQDFERRSWIGDLHTFAPASIGSDSTTDGLSALYFTDGTGKGSITFTSNSMVIASRTANNLKFAFNGTEEVGLSDGAGGTLTLAAGGGTNGSITFRTFLSDNTIATRWVMSATSGNLTQDATYGGDIVMSKAATGVSFFKSYSAAAKLRMECSELSGTGGTTQTWTSAIPANAMVFHVSGYTSEAYTSGGTITSVDYGVTGTANAYANTRPLTVGTTWDAPTAGAASTLPLRYGVVTNIVATANGGGTITAGKTHVCVYYIDFDLPTS